MRLNEENLRRQQIESVILKEAVVPFKDHEPDRESKSIVLDSYNWHTGEAGHTASKITELTYRPTVLIALEDGWERDLDAAYLVSTYMQPLTSCSDLLLSFGGHEQAAGLSILEENVPKLRERLNVIAGDMLCDEDFKAKLKIDEQLKMDDITDRFVEELALLEPYGPAILPRYLQHVGLPVASHRYVGAESNHLKLKTGVRRKDHRRNWVQDGLQEFRCFGYPVRHRKGGRCIFAGVQHMGKEQVD